MTGTPMQGRTNPWAWQPQQPAYARLAASVIRLEGSGSRRFLHGQTSAAIELAPPGQWISSCCISPTGRMRALAEVLVDQDAAWLVISGGDGTQVHQSLDRVLFPADRMRLGPAQRAWWLLPVAAAGHLQDASQQGEPAAPWPTRSGSSGSWQTWADGRGWQLHSGDAGVIAPDEPSDSRSQSLVLLADGTPPSDEQLPAAWAGLQPLSAAEQEHWRIQQGLPAVPGELSDDHNPFELGLAPRVSLNKGCYVGQETLAKLATYDGVKQQLRRWHWRRTASEQAPEAGQELRGPASAARDGEGQSDRRLGRISSMLELPDGDRIGLALVRRQGLEQAELQAGCWSSSDAAPATLALSTPAQFMAPPVGAGGSGG
jgi:tRNA-modifying protein YgfZ